MKNRLLRNFLLASIMVLSFLIGVLFIRNSNSENEIILLTERINKLESDLTLIMNPEPDAQVYEGFYG